MKTILVFVLQCVILSYIQAQNITINDIVGEYCFPSIAENNENIFFFHDGSTAYYKKPIVKEYYSGDGKIIGDVLVEITYNEKIGAYELSNSIIRAFSDIFHTNILYEFEVLDSMNLRVLFSNNEAVKKGAIFNRISSAFEGTYLYNSPAPWRIFLTKDGKYECTFFSIKGPKPVEGNYYRIDDVRILPKKIYKRNKKHGSCLRMVD